MDPCSRAGLPAPAPDGIDSLDASVTGGTLHGKPGGVISMAAGVTIDMKSDLVVVADDDLVIDGHIIFPWRMGAGEASLNITLVSLKGKVVIGPKGFVGNGFAARGADDSVLGKGGSGSDGGLIRILGINIDIQGSVLGNGGGDGGDGSTLNVGPLVGLIGIFLANAVGLPGLARILGGLLTSTGGQGGKGGDVVLCAVDSIHTAGAAKAEAGQAGWGGEADCQTSTGFGAQATGGGGGSGGDVSLRGPSATALTQVFNEGNLLGGRAGGGRKAYASSISGRACGAPATAVGGRAGKGGTVDFFGCAVVTAGFTKAGDGDVPGGDAEAHADKGGSGFFGGQAGGSATAIGGQGGRPGDTPSLPMATGQIQKGYPGGPGKGGDAYAVAGIGGDGSSLVHSSGGASGAAFGQGGSDGTGAPPAGGPVTFGPAPPSGSDGGVTSTAAQLGKP
jgi:hypothetical protein